VADVIQEDCSCAGVPPLANFTACTATPLSCGTVLYGSTVGATAELVPTCVTTNTPTSGGVWYVLNPPFGGTYTINTCGSFFNTRLRVYSGTCNSLTCVTGNQNFAGCGVGFLTNSQVTFNAQGGTTYYILVHGLQEGTFRLHVFCEAYDCPTLTANVGEVCSLAMV
jgi:hypothetical protein